MHSYLATKHGFRDGFFSKFLSRSVLFCVIPRWFSLRYWDWLVQQVTDLIALESSLDAMILHLRFEWLFIRTQPQARGHISQWCKHIYPIFPHFLPLRQNNILQIHHSTRRNHFHSFPNHLTASYREKQNRASPLQWKDSTVRRNYSILRPRTLYLALIGHLCCRFIGSAGRSYMINRLP